MASPLQPGGFLKGFRMPLHAARVLLQQPGVKRVAILPVLVNLLVYAIVLFLALTTLWNWDWQLTGEPWQFWGGFGGWLHATLDGFLDVLKWLLALPVLFFFCYFTFTVVGMIVASPFNDMLSERIEEALCQPQSRPKLTWREQGRLMIVSLLDSLTILLRQLGWTLLALPFLLIPYLGFLPLFLVTAYHTGLGFVDVAMARNYLRHRHKKLLIREHRRTLIGIGVAMELMFMVPFLGLLILPLGVVSGTLLYCGFDWESRFRAFRVDPPQRFVVPRLRQHP